MRCWRCKLPVGEYAWTTRSDKGVRHLQCPNPNGKRAKERVRRAQRCRESALDPTRAIG